MILRNKLLVLALAFLLSILPFQVYSSSLKYIMLKINSKRAYVNMNPVQLDVAPIEKNGRTLVPLRFIAEHFGARNITYFPETEEISLELEDANMLRLDVSRLNDMLVLLQNENQELRSQIAGLQQRIRELENSKPAPPEPEKLPPSAPQGFSATLTGTQVLLSWKASVVGSYPLAGYKVYRSSGDDINALLMSVLPGNRLSFIDSQTLEGQTYVYFVRAFDTSYPALESSESARVKIQIPGKTNPEPPPTPPTPPPPSPPPEDSDPSMGKSRMTPVPFFHPYLTKEGFEITVSNLTQGEEAWQIIKQANSLNSPPEQDKEYVLVSVKVKNVSTAKDPSSIDRYFFSLIGSSDKLIETYHREVFLPSDGAYKELKANLYHGDETEGTIVFYVPKYEYGMRLIWNPTPDDASKRIYFEVRRW